MSQQPILVTGATGRQGGAVMRHLLLRGRTVRALTRDPASDKARRIAAAGVEIVKGDLDDRQSIVRALDGVQAVFSVQDPWLHGVSAEIRQGTQLGDLALEAGIRRFVYASVGSANVATGVPHFDSKGIIERHLASLPLEVHAIRPVFFMQSLLQRYDRHAPYALGLLRSGLRGKRVQLVSVDDVGRVAAEILSAEEASAPGFQGVELAGDELSYDEIIATFARIGASRPKSLNIPLWPMWMLNRKAYLNYRWIGDHGWRFNLADMRSRRPWLSDFRFWLQADAEASHARVS